MMTRKHFQKTADILNRRIRMCLVNVDGVSTPGLVLPAMEGDYNQLESLAHEMADWFEEENSSFDRDIFMRAVFRTN